MHKTAMKVTGKKGASIKLLTSKPKPATCNKYTRTLALSTFESLLKPSCCEMSPLCFSDVSYLKQRTAALCPGQISPRGQKSLFHCILFGNWFRFWFVCGFKVCVHTWFESYLWN